MFHISFFMVIESLVILALLLALTFLIVYIIKTETGINKWINIIGIFALMIILIFAGHISLDSQTIQKFNKW